MIRTGTPDAAAANRRKLRLPNGTGYFRSEFIASPFDAAPAPQSFLVEQDPDSVILPHFHVQNEFQVVVQGSGSIGRHPVRPLTVHYTGAHTGYGPITAGPGGLWYFTLRPAMDPGALFLPESRGRMQKGPKRHLLGRPLVVSEDCARRTGASCEVALAPQADGIGGWMLRIPPGGALAAPVLARGFGRFYLVASGRARVTGAMLARLATVFVTPEEEPVEVRAGAEGAEVLVLQFPEAGGA
jgi:hypothetical protein